MSGVFDAYAAYYDLLYRDKDYTGEAAWVDGLIQRHRPGAKQVLELGCGTGAHAMELVKLGYSVTGIDQSAAMVDGARQRATQANVRVDRARFDTGDLRDYRNVDHFDVVLSLFHVMSYQTTNADLLAGMRTAAAHMAPGGVFVFDCWYGPGVLTDPPVTRIRRLQGDGFSITRLAEPVHHISGNRVDVNYDVLVERNGAVEHIRERHAMRYLFEPEVALLAEAAGLRVAACTQWLNDEVPTASTWNACFVLTR